MKRWPGTGRCRWMIALSSTARRSAFVSTAPSSCARCDCTVDFWTMSASSRLVSDLTMANVLLAGIMLAAFGAWRRWGRFRGEKPVWY